MTCGIAEGRGGTGQSVSAVAGLAADAARRDALARCLTSLCVAAAVAVQQYSDHNPLAKEHGALHARQGPALAFLRTLDRQ